MIIFLLFGVSLGDTVLDGFAVLGVDHGLIFVGYLKGFVYPKVAPALIGRWYLPSHEAY